MLIPDYEPDGDLLSDDIEIGLNKIDVKLALITLAAADKDVGSVTCDANVIVTRPETTPKEFSISYIVRPDVEDENGFVIRGDFGSAAEYVAAATSSAISRAQIDRLEAASASSIDAQETDTLDATAQQATEEANTTTQDTDMTENSASGM
jgi:hypothetical protein